MRAFDRDLIRGGHYGQRSCEPHPKAEHMAAPTNAAYVKKALANSEPSTHGPERQFAASQRYVRNQGLGDMPSRPLNRRDPERTPQQCPSAAPGHDQSGCERRDLDPADRLHPTPVAL